MGRGNGGMRTVYVFVNWRRSEKSGSPGQENFIGDILNERSKCSRRMKSKRHVHRYILLSLDLLKATPLPAPLLGILEPPLLAAHPAAAVAAADEAEVGVQPLEALAVDDALQDLRVVVVAEAHARERVDLRHRHAVRAVGPGREERLLGVGRGDGERLVEGLVGERGDADGAGDAGEFLDGLEVGEVFLRGRMGCQWAGSSWLVGGMLPRACSVSLLS